MSYENVPAKHGSTHRYINRKYKILDYVARNYIHIVLITLCALLLSGDFLTTSIALSLAETGDGASTISVVEANPFMAAVANSPILFLFIKGLILQVVIATAYMLRKEGALAYLPCVLVCSFYIWVNMNNINILTTALM
jgi:hypothetical protein